MVVKTLQDFKAPYKAVLVDHGVRIYKNDIFETDYPFNLFGSNRDNVEKTINYAWRQVYL